MDVGGVLAADRASLLYLFGLLNAPVCNYVWRRISKPFQNDFRSANKQFIAPLPIPDATPAQRAAVGKLALRLQELHTRGRELADALDARLASAQTEPFEPGPEWLWAELRTAADWKSQAPATLRGAERTAWAKAHHAALLAGHGAVFDLALGTNGTSACEVSAVAGRLTLRINGQTVVELFDKPETPWIAAQWRHALRGFHGDGKRLLARLLKLRLTAEAALRDAVVRLDADLAALESDTAAAEAEMNALVFALYALTPSEQAQVVKG